MREILFRGMHRQSEMVFGSLTLKYGRAIIIINDEVFFVVDINTVGQFTGLLDKNGLKIFESDIVQTRYSNKVELVETVVFKDGKFMAMTEFEEIKMYAFLADGITRVSFDKSVYMTECEVIGNIHENSELSEEK